MNAIQFLEREHGKAKAASDADWQGLGGGAAGEGGRPDERYAGEGRPPVKRAAAAAPVQA